MIYLDNASTTMMSEASKRAAANAMDLFGNPSSMHRLGIESEKLVEASKAAVADALSVQKKYVFFTSGGTEANNLAIIGSAKYLKKRGNKIITTKIEHPSVTSAFKALEDDGFEVSYLSCGSDGRIDLAELEEELTEKTTLVSIMAVNNETGIIQPVKEACGLVREKSPLALFHSDCVQAFGKVDCSPRDTGADLVTVSAHKLHGPKGVGALYIKTGKISPIIFGGGQQNGIRPGTENVIGIAGFGAAVQESYGDCSELYDTLKSEIEKNIPSVKINGDPKYASKHVLNVSFVGIRAEILLHTLESSDIFVSTGSACSTHKPQPSPVLTAMGCSKKEIEGAVRFSFDSSLTKEDMIFTAEVLKKEVALLRKYIR